MSIKRKTQAWKRFALRFLEVSHLKQFILRTAMIAVPYGWHILFFVIPFIIVLKLSFSESVLGSPPYTNLLTWIDDTFLQIRLNIHNYTFLWEDELYLRSYLESLKNAGIATVGCFVLGYPLAYGITRAHSLMRVVLLMLVILPFWTSFLVRVYSWIGILSNTGLLNSFLLYVGIIKEPLPLINNNFAVILGLIYSYVPFMVLPLYASLEKIDPHYIEAAYDLGCKPFKAFFKILIPLSSRGIIGGSLLVFIPAVGEYVIPALLGGSNSLMVGRVLWNEFFTNHDWPLASALVVTLFLFLVIPMIVFQRFTREVVEEEEE